MLSILKGEDKIFLNKKWRVDQCIVSVTKEIDINWSLQDRIYQFNIPVNNPFVPVFYDEDYTLLKVVDDIVDIYYKQGNVHNTWRSSDLFLQYIMKDSDGKWTGKEASTDVMIIDIYPSLDEESIQKLKAAVSGCNNIYSVKYSGSMTSQNI